MAGLKPSLALLCSYAIHPQQFGSAPVEATDHIDRLGAVQADLSSSTVAATQAGKTLSPGRLAGPQSAAFDEGGDSASPRHPYKFRWPSTVTSGTGRLAGTFRPMQQNGRRKPSTPSTALEPHINDAAACELQLVQPEAVHSHSRHGHHV